MRRAAALVAAVMIGGGVGAASRALAGAPPGATALCRDGTYSYSQHHSGTCSHHGGVARWLDGSSPAGTSSTAAGVAATVTFGRTVVVGRRTAARGCRRGTLPDRRCSPGAYYSSLTRAVICSSTFRTSTIRRVSEAEKHAVELEYGMAARPYGRTIEIDHIVPLELGGSNAIANLYPEPGAGAASYHAKDRLENRLRLLVCTGRMTLAGARRGIAVNWEALYERVFAPAP